VDGGRGVDGGLGRSRFAGGAGGVGIADAPEEAAADAVARSLSSEAFNLNGWHSVMFVLICITVSWLSSFVHVACIIVFGIRYNEIRFVSSGCMFPYG